MTIQQQQQQQQPHDHNNNSQSSEDLNTSTSSNSTTIKSNIDKDDSLPYCDYDEKDLELQSINDKGKFNDTEDNNKDNIIGDDNDQGSQHKKYYGPPHPFKHNEKVIKFSSLGWGIITILISGTLYGFSIISHEIKEKLDYFQSDISEAISIGDIGIYLGVTGGYFYDVFGPFFTCLVAACLYTIGYMGSYGVVSKKLPKNPLLLAFFLFLVGQASHATFTAAVVSNIHNFPIRHRAKLSGLLTGCFALSSGLFGVIYKGTFKKSKNVEGYLMFLAILLASVSLIGSYLIRFIGHKDDIQNTKPKKVNNNILSSSGPLSKIQDPNNNDTFASSNQELPKTKREGNDKLFSFVNNVKLKSKKYQLLNNESINDDDITNFTVGDEEDGEKDENSSSSSSSNTGLGSGDLTTMIVDEYDDIDPTSGPNYLDGKRDITGLKLWMHVEYIILFINYFFVAGGSLMFLNNISSFVDSLNLDDSFSSDLVIIFSVCNLSGRIGFGLLSDYISKKYSRFWLVCVCSSSLSIILLCFAIFMKQFFLVACVLVPIVYGGTVSMMVSLTSLRFGSRRFGLNFGFLCFASASGSFVFGEISGKIYDSFADDKHNCYGEKCFRSSFLISCSCIFACVFILMGLIYKLNRIRMNSIKINNDRMINSSTSSIIIPNDITK